jgi:ATP-dependent exoDNAse (exonuclease V) beta subunit
MWMDASALVSTIVTDLRFFELALVHRRPRDHWQRLRWLVDQVRAFDEAKGGSLADFLEWVDLSEEAERWSSALGAPEADDDAVRVMTVHGAKGLEFPVVVLTGLDGAPSNVSPPVIFEREGTPRFSFNRDFRSPGYEALARADKNLGRAERLRLLYVALTRARDHLVVDLHHKENSRDALAAKLHPICEGCAEEVARLTPVSRSADPPSPTAPVEPAVLDWWSEHGRWLQARERLLGSNARQPAWSATALSNAASASTSALPPSGSTLDAPTAHRDQQSQRGIGRAVHDALAKIDLPADGTMTSVAIEVATSAARAQNLDDGLIDVVIALVRAALETPLVRSIARARHWKELPLAAAVPSPGAPPEDRAVIEGFADLVGDTESGLIVVDFKTSGGRSSTSRYLSQVATYAFTLQEATGRDVARVVVLYLSEDGTREESLEGADLSRAIDDVLRAARSDVGSAHVADSGQLLLFPNP